MVSQSLRRLSGNSCDVRRFGSEYEDRVQARAAKTQELPFHSGVLVDHSIPFEFGKLVRRRMLSRARLSRRK